MYCIHCGTYLDEHSKFCSNCGSKAVPLEIPVSAPESQNYCNISTPQKAAKPVRFSVFPFISASISATMFFVALFPWFTLNNDPYTLYKMLDYSFMLEYYGVSDFGICTILMFICIALLIPSFILALVKRNRMPLVFPIITSSITTISLIIFVSVMPSYSYVLASTPVPIFLFILSVANIVFAILAKKK